VEINTLLSGNEQVTFPSAEITALRASILIRNSNFIPAYRYDFDSQSPRDADEMSTE
jgi:hypothetical protein